jgi:hypothetical protein
MLSAVPAIVINKEFLMLIHISRFDIITLKCISEKPLGRIS